MKISLTEPVGWILVAAGMVGLAASVVTLVRYYRQGTVKKAYGDLTSAPQPTQNAAAKAPTVAPDPYGDDNPASSDGAWDARNYAGL